MLKCFSLMTFLLGFVAGCGTRAPQTQEGRMPAPPATPIADEVKRSENAIPETGESTALPGLTAADFRKHEWEVVRLPTNHSVQINSLAFSNDNRVLASGGENGSVVLWDFKSGRVIKVLEDRTSPSYPVLSVSFAPDNKTLAAGRDGGSVLLWDTSTEAKIKRNGIKHGNKATSVAFAPHQAEMLLATGADDGSVIARELRIGKEVESDSWVQLLASTQSVIGRHEGRVYRMRFSADANLLATAGKDHKVVLWDVVNQKQVAAKSGGPYWAVSIAIGEEVLAVGSWDGKVQQFQLPNLDEGLSLDIGHGIKTAHCDVAISPDGTVIVWGGGTELALWNTTSGKLLATYDEFVDVRSVEFSPDGRVLAIGDRLDVVLLTKPLE